MIYVDVNRVMIYVDVTLVQTTLHSTSDVRILKAQQNRQRIRKATALDS